MNKTFTIKVPNELYIDDFSENKTAEYTYNGPEKLLIEVDGDGGCLTIVDQPREFLTPDRIYYVELDANADTAAAHFLWSRPSLTEHEVEEVINEYDGSTYLKIKNPYIQDYYTLRHIDRDTDPWEFTLITRNQTSSIEFKVQNDQKYVQSSLEDFALPDDLQATYDQYIADTNAWLAEKAPLHPWKFIDFPAGNVPKIPLTLIKVINELGNTGVN